MHKNQGEVCVGLVDAYPYAVYWRRTCKILLNIRRHRIDLLVAEYIIANVNPIITDPNLKISETLS